MTKPRRANVSCYTQTVQVAFKPKNSMKNVSGHYTRTYDKTKHMYSSQAL